jgi:hypothetical protein
MARAPAPAWRSDVKAIGIDVDPPANCVPYTAALIGDIRPLGIQLFSEDDAEGGLDALADFRILGVQRDLSIRRNLHVRAGIERRALRTWRTATTAARLLRFGLVGTEQAEGQEQATAHRRCRLHEAATRNRLGAERRKIQRFAFEFADLLANHIWVVFIVDYGVHVALPFKVLAADLMAARIRT